MIDRQTALQIEGMANRQGSAMQQFEGSTMAAILLFRSLLVGLNKPRSLWGHSIKDTVESEKNVDNAPAESLYSVRWWARVRYALSAFLILTKMPYGQIRNLALIQGDPANPVYPFRADEFVPGDEEVTMESLIWQDPEEGANVDSPRRRNQ